VLPCTHRCIISSSITFCISVQACTIPRFYFEYSVHHSPPHYSCSLFLHQVDSLLAVFKSFTSVQVVPFQISVHCCACGVPPPAAIAACVLILMQLIALAYLNHLLLSKLFRSKIRVCYMCVPGVLHHQKLRLLFSPDQPALFLAVFKSLTSVQEVPLY
jgi:hypothetical protein